MRFRESAHTIAEAHRVRTRSTEEGRAHTLSTRRPGFLDHHRQARSRRLSIWHARIEERQQRRQFLPGLPAFPKAAPPAQTLQMPPALSPGIAPNPLVLPMWIQDSGRSPESAAARVLWPTTGQTGSPRLSPQRIELGAQPASIPKFQPLPVGIKLAQIPDDSSRFQSSPSATASIGVNRDIARPSIRPHASGLPRRSEVVSVV